MHYSFARTPWFANAESSIMRTRKTSYGQTRTHSALPSHLARSMTGAERPGLPLHSEDWLTAIAAYRHMARTTAAREPAMPGVRTLVGLKSAIIKLSNARTSLIRALLSLSSAFLRLIPAWMTLILALLSLSSAFLRLIPAWMTLILALLSL